MIICIKHLNGDEKGVRGNENRSYDEFLERVRNNIRRASKANATIVYFPLFSGDSDGYYTPESASLERHAELKSKFPFLEGLDGIRFTLLPDADVERLDSMIQNDLTKTAIFGGIYRQACVAASALNAKVRNPDAHIYIGKEISFENGFSPISGYGETQHVLLDDWLAEGKVFPEYPAHF